MNNPKWWFCGFGLCHWVTNWLPWGQNGSKCGQKTSQIGEKPQIFLHKKATRGYLYVMNLFFSLNNLYWVFWGLVRCLQVIKWLHALKSCQNWPKNVKNNQKILQFLLCFGTQELLYRPSTTVFSVNDLNWGFWVSNVCPYASIMSFLAKTIPT